MSPANAYVYIRWSSLKQERGDSRERQERDCLAHCAAKGWTLAEDPFGDYGVSAWKGDHLKAGELGRFAERVRCGDIPPGRVLVVEGLDRLSRQEPRITQRWIEDLTDLGVRIATVSGDRIYDRDSLRSAGGIMEVIEILLKAKLAHEHSETISTRLKSSWERRRKEAAEGVVVSSHAPGWLRVVGNRKEAGRRFEVIDERADIVREIYRLAADGMGAKSIARTLNQRGVATWGRAYHYARSKTPGWEHTYVADILKSPAVEGDYQPTSGRRRQRDEIGEAITGYFPRVVEADLVERARAAVESRKGRRGGGRNQQRLSNLFVGLIRCASCNGPMTMIGNANKPAHYLVCQSAARGLGCVQKKSFNYRPFEAAALDAMLHLALDDRFFVTPGVAQKIANDIAETRKAVEVKRAAARNLAQGYAANGSATLLTMLTETEAEIASLVGHVEELEGALSRATGAASPQAHLARVTEVRGALEAEDQETRLAARRKVITAIAGVVTSVVCDANDSFGGEVQKTLTVVMVGGVHAIKFANDGRKLGEAGVVPAVVASRDVREAVTGGDPRREAMMSGYLRRQAAR